MSPAMAARLETRLWDVADIVTPIEEWEVETGIDPDMSSLRPQKPRDYADGRLLVLL
jgi:hypothetical protein